MIQAIQFILSLSILIVLHEMGHFLPAKFFKTKIEKFYLFFDPWFSLFKFKRGETEYGIGWLPLGGYVKIAGMIDESMDKEQMKLAPQPWEFRSKPAWQRLIIMCGGVTVNLLLGAFIYAMVLFTCGEKYLPAKNILYGVACDSSALEMGFKDGDKIVSVDNKQVDDFYSITSEIVLNKAKTVQVIRDGNKMDIPVKEEYFSQAVKGKTVLFDERFPCEVDSIMSGTAAAKSGLKKNDRIVSVVSTPTPYFQDVTKALKINSNKEISFKILRTKDTLTLNAFVSPDGKLGFMPRAPDQYFDFVTRSYGFFESFPAGIKKAAEVTGKYAKSLGLLFTVKDAHKSLGGFITLGKAYSPSWDWPHFWQFTGFLSLVLAIMNILPIPALDGGHVLFLLFEVITGRKPNEKVMEYAQYAGMILLFGILIYANSNDVVRLFSK